MNGVRAALSNYLGQKTPQPNLVVGEPDATAKEMKDLGFKKKGQFWVISRNDARKALETLFDVVSFDWSKHWGIEKGARENAIPRPS